MLYPVELTPDDNDTVMLTFPDVPEAVTFGADEAEALANAADALETALNGYITDRRDIPAPSDLDGRPGVGPSLLGELKLAIYRAMRDRDWRKADLARSMGVNPRQIDRLLDLAHASTVAQLEQASYVVGNRYVIGTCKMADTRDHRYHMAS
jgi:antitoxin HicB